MAPYPEPISRATDRSSSPSIGTHGRSLKIEHPKVMLSPGQRARTAGHLRPNSNSVPDRIVKWSSSRTCVAAFIDEPSAGSPSARGHSVAESHDWARRPFRLAQQVLARQFSSRLVAVT